jgi:hypothetical protein
MTDLKVGEYYNVTCAEIMMDDGRKYDIPVFDHLHADAQFGFLDKHYHIDGRFELHPRMHHYFNLESGHTSTVILPEGSNVYRFLGIVTRYLKCSGLETGLVLPYNSCDSKLELYLDWYISYVGKTCTGRKCPHFGTDMFEKNGQLVCPMHNLTADIHSLKVILT